jgi:hypothetical protein
VSAFHALDAARAAGIEVRLDGKELIVSAASEPPAGVLDMLRQHKRSIVGLLQPTQPWDPVDWLGYYYEKAAIGEFDHGMSRQEAQEHAHEHCIGVWLYQHPISSDAKDGCLACGETDRPNDGLLPVGLGGGEVWLHVECSAAWRASRIAEAVSALTAMGIRGPEGSSPGPAVAGQYGRMDHPR